MSGRYDAWDKAVATMETYIRERLQSGRKSYKSLIMPIGEAKWANYAPLDECLRRLRKAGVILHARAGGGKVAGYEFAPGASS